MGRTIITQSYTFNQVNFDEKNTLISYNDNSLELSESNYDNYFDKLLKLIPSEVIAVYITLEAIVKSSKPTSEFLYWIIFCFCAAFFYLKLNAKVTKQKQLILSTFSFGVWIFAIGGTIYFFYWYEPIYGSLLLIMYTFSIPILKEFLRIIRKNYYNFLTFISYLYIFY